MPPEEFKTKKRLFYAYLIYNCTETLESIYILYRITGDPKYQEYGWEIFQSLEKHCKTGAAYASIYNVDDINTSKMDSMER